MCATNYKLVRSTKEDDCDECIFTMHCVDMCRAPKGWHYEAKTPKNKTTKK